MKMFYPVKIFNTDRPDWDKWTKAYTWCREMCTVPDKKPATWYNTPRDGYYYFTREEDAIAFRLKFGL